MKSDVRKWVKPTNNTFLKGVQKDKSATVDEN